MTELNGRTANWTYDGIYRMTSETISLDPAKHNGSVSYGLDPVGNRLSETSTLSDVNSGTFGFNADDQLSSETYDANGNITAASAKTFSYDSENHLVAMNGGAVRIVYDGFGNLVAKTLNGVTTTYLVEDDVNPTGYPQVFDELTNGVVTRIYSYGLQRISEEQVLNNTWTTSFYGYDGGGNVRQLTNSAGTITDSYEYDAFGNSFTISGTTPNNYLYRGEQWDPDLGLYYLRARYYNPTTGRFISEDPMGFRAGTNFYRYVLDDPTDYRDPYGRDPVIGGIAGGIMGGIYGGMGAASTGGDGWDIATGALLGAGIGYGLGALDPSLGGAVVLGGLAGAAGDAAGQFVTNYRHGTNCYNVPEIVGAGIGGGLGGAAGAGLGAAGIGASGNWTMAFINQFLTGTLGLSGTAAGWSNGEAGTKSKCGCH